MAVSRGFAMFESGRGVIIAECRGIALAVSKEVAMFVSSGITIPVSIGVSLSIAVVCPVVVRRLLNYLFQLSLLDPESCDYFEALLDNLLTSIGSKSGEKVS